MRSDLHHPWSADDDLRLTKLYEDEQLGPIEIAERLRRPTSSVRSRLTKLRKDGVLGPARGRGGRPSRDGGPT